MLQSLSSSKPVRVVFAAFAFCVLAFAAGVAGDLSMAASPVTHGQRVTLVIPPDAPRAHPLPPLPHTEAASAAIVRVHAVRRERMSALRIKPRDPEELQTVAKIDLDHAPKADIDLLG